MFSPNHSLGCAVAEGARDSWGYLVIWEFRVRPGMELRFREVYGSAGLWARLFRQDRSYLGTELVQALPAERTYLTLDFWSSQAAYDHFRAERAADYKTIDQQCEEMTESEREVGRFLRVDGPA